MIIVVSQVNEHYLLPRWLFPLRDLFQKANGYAFEDFESIDRFVGGLQKWLKDNKLHSRYLVNHRGSDHHGIIEIARPEGRILTGIEPSKKQTVMLSMKYFKPFGHVSVSKDGQALFQQDFIKEGE